MASIGRLKSTYGDNLGKIVGDTVVQNDHVYFQIRLDPKDSPKWYNIFVNKQGGGHFSTDELNRMDPQTRLKLVAACVDQYAQHFFADEGLAGLSGGKVLSITRDSGTSRAGEDEEDTKEYEEGDELGKVAKDIFDLLEMAPTSSGRRRSRSPSSDLGSSVSDTDSEGSRTPSPHRHRHSHHSPHHRHDHTPPVPSATQEALETALARIADLERRQDTFATTDQLRAQQEEIGLLRAHIQDIEGRLGGRIDELQRQLDDSHRHLLAYLNDEAAARRRGDDLGATALQEAIIQQDAARAQLRTELYAALADQRAAIQWQIDALNLRVDGSATRKQLEALEKKLDTVDARLTEAIHEEGRTRQRDLEDIRRQINGLPTQDQFRALSSRLEQHILATEGSISALQLALAHERADRGREIESAIDGEKRARTELERTLRALIEQQRSELQDQIDGLQRRIRALEAKPDLNVDIEALRRQLGDLQSELASLRLAQQAGEERLTTLIGAERFARIQADDTERTERVRDVSDLRRDFQRDIARLRQYSISEWDTLSQSFFSIIRQQNDRISALQRGLDDEHGTRVRDIEEARRDRALLRRELEEIRSALGRQIHELEVRILGPEGSNTALHKDLELLRIHMSGFSQALVDLREEFGEQLSGVFTDIDTLFRENEARKADIEAEAGTRFREIGNLAGKIHALEQMMSRVEVDLEGLDRLAPEQLAEFGRRLDKEIRDRRNLGVAVTSLGEWCEYKFNIYDRDIRELQSRPGNEDAIATLREQQAALADQLTGIRADQARQERTLRERIDALHAICVTLSEQGTVGLRALQELREITDGLTRALRDVRAGLETEIRDRKAGDLELRALITALDKKIPVGSREEWTRILRFNFGGVEADIAELKRRNPTLQTQFDELSAQVTRWQQENASIAYRMEVVEGQQADLLDRQSSLEARFATLLAGAEDAVAELEASLRLRYTGDPGNVLTRIIYCIGQRNTGNAESEAALIHALGDLGFSIPEGADKDAAILAAITALHQQDLRHQAKVAELETDIRRLQATSVTKQEWTALSQRLENHLRDYQRELAAGATISSDYKRRFSQLEALYAALSEKVDRSLISTERMLTIITEFRQTTDALRKDLDKEIAAREEEGAALRDQIGSVRGLSQGFARDWNTVRAFFGLDGRPGRDGLDGIREAIRRLQDQPAIPPEVGALLDKVNRWQEANARIPEQIRAFDTRQVDLESRQVALERHFTSLIAGAEGPVAELEKALRIPAPPQGTNILVRIIRCIDASSRQSTAPNPALIKALKKLGFDIPKDADPTQAITAAFTDLKAQVDDHERRILVLEQQMRAFEDVLRAQEASLGRLLPAFGGLIDQLARIEATLGDLARTGAHRDAHTLALEAQIRILRARWNGVFEGLIPLRFLRDAGTQARTAMPAQFREYYSGTGIGSADAFLGKFPNIQSGDMREKFEAFKKAELAALDHLIKESAKCQTGGTTQWRTLLKAFSPLIAVMDKFETQYGSNPTFRKALTKPASERELPNTVHPDASALGQPLSLMCQLAWVSKFITVVESSEEGANLGEGFFAHAIGRNLPKIEGSEHNESFRVSQVQP